jgi:hypothetical protein
LESGQEWRVSIGFVHYFGFCLVRSTKKKSVVVGGFRKQFYLCSIRKQMNKQENEWQKGFKPTTPPILK